MHTSTSFRNVGARTRLVLTGAATIASAAECIRQERPRRTRIRLVDNGLPNPRDMYTRECDRGFARRRKLAQAERGPAKPPLETGNRAAPGAFDRHVGDASRDSPCRPCLGQEPAPVTWKPPAPAPPPLHCTPAPDPVHFLRRPDFGSSWARERPLLASGPPPWCGKGRSNPTDALSGLVLDSLADPSGRTTNRPGMRAVRSASEPPASLHHPDQPRTPLGPADNAGVSSCGAPQPSG